MHNTSRRWLVGIGLMVALLALATPAFAQNVWVKQGSPAAFPTPVQTMAVNPAGTFVSAGTYGGGYPGGNLGYQYYSLDSGVTFTQNALTPCPPFAGPGDDYTSTLWDGTYGYTGTWNSGLYVWDGVTVTNPTCGEVSVNQHVSSLAFDSGVAGVGIPHNLYFGTWGGGIYNWTGAAYNHVFDPLVDLVNGAAATPNMFFIHQIVVIPAACPGSARTIYAGTDGAGVLKGVQSCTTGNWTWTTVNGGLTGQDLYVTSLVRGSGYILAGTKAGGIFLLSGSTWNLLPGSPEDQGHAYNVPNILLVGFPNNVFAATEGGGVYRWDDDRATFHAINNGYGTADLTDLQVHALAYNPANQVLYAGTTDHVSGTAGNAWHIQLTPPVLTFASPFTYEVGDSVNDVVGVTSANQAPANWFAMITAGALPPGLAEGVNNTPYPPVVNVSGSPTEDGCYTATLTVWDDLFNRVDLAADYFINPGVAIDAIPNPAPFGTVMNFSSVVTGAMGSVTYEWDFDSTGVQVAPGTWISADPNPTFIYPVADSYVAQLTVTDDLGGGCVRVTVKTIPIDVFGALTASPTATQTGSGAQFQFKANATGGNPICATVDGYSYAWEFKDANTGTVLFTSNVANPIITFANTGDFIGEVTVTDCDGHSYTASVSVNWNGSMAATLSSSNNPAPSNYPIEFTATGLAGALYSFYDFTFDMGDGTVIGPIPWAGPPGTVPTVPVVYAYTGVCPTADFTVTATIVANSVLPTPPLTTVVTFTQHVYAAFLGVTGSVVPDPLTCQLTSDQAITLTLQPNGLPDCAQGGLKPFRYSIDWGDGATTTMDFNDYAAHSFPHMYAAGGPYTITAYVTDTGNPQVTQTYVHGPFTVIAPLSATTPYVDGLRCNQGDAFGVQLSTLTGSRLVSFSTVNSGGVGPYTYVWNFGDGTATSTAAAPTHTYTIPAGYNHYTWTATVTVTDTGDCSSPHHVVTNTIKFTLFYPLSIVGTPDWQQQCGSRTVDFDATSNVQGGIEPYSYVWNFDDGTSQTTTVPYVSHTYATSGGYDVQLTVTDSSLENCGTTHYTRNVIWHIEVVDPLLGTASATPTTGCAPLAVAFTSSVHGGGQPGDAFQLQWDFGDGTVTGWGASATQNHTYAAGTWTWTLTARSTIVPANYICQIATGTIHVYAPASGLMIVPTSTSDYIPLDDTFTTTWTAGAGPFNVDYTITRIKDKDGNFLPVPQVYTATANDVTSPYQFTYTFNNTGTWTVVCHLTDTATNCPDLDSNTVTLQVLDTPALTVTTQTLINGVIGTSGLSPLTVNFSSVPQGGVAPYTFLWTFADGTTSTAQNPIHTYNTPGVYNVTLQVTDSYPALAGGPQQATAGVTITVYNPLTVVASATSATTLVAGGTVNFSATATGGAGGYTYTWNFGDGGVGTGATTSHVYATAGTYFARVHVTDTATNFVDSNDVVIRVLTPVTVAASATPSTVIVNNPVTFTALASGGSGTYTIAWTFGDGTNGAGGTVNHTYTTLGTKTVVVTVTDNALATNVATQTIQVVVKPVPPSITYAKKLTDPFRIVLFGSNFQNGCVATINGVPVTVKFVNGGKLKLKNAKSLCPKGVPVTIVVTNPDGGVSNSFQFVR